jgi:hypothetical protein
MTTLASRAFGALLLAFASIGLIGAGPPQSDMDDATGECIQRSECCKVCNAGKACGNSCISRRYNCHKGRGCACDAEEVCE